MEPDLSMTKTTVPPLTTSPNTALVVVVVVVVVGAVVVGQYFSMSKSLSSIGAEKSWLKRYIFETFMPPAVWMLMRTGTGTSMRDHCFTLETQEG